MKAILQELRWWWLIWRGNRAKTTGDLHTSGQSLIDAVDDPSRPAR